MHGFEEWYRGHHPRLLAAVTVMTGDVDDAREVTAEAFSRALERWDAVSVMDNPAGWTYVVAANLTRRRWLHRRRERFAAHDLPRSDPPIPEHRMDVYRALRALPDRARTAVVLRYFGGLTEAEVAGAMGVAVGTASATLAQARQRLSVLLAGYQITEERP